MKKCNSIFIITLALFTLGCKKEDIITYNDVHYVQFTRNITDTLDFSFFFYPGKDEVLVALPVKLIGRMPAADLSYQIAVVQEDSNAPDNIYTLPNTFTFRKGLAQDTAYITFRNAVELRSQKYKLSLQIQNTSEVKAGQTNYARYAFRISDMVTKPTWWNAEMDRFYLGVYGEKKFRAFMEVTGIGDLSVMDFNEARIYMIQFKHYLIEMKGKGTPLLMEDGTDMLSTIPLVG